MVEKTEKEKKLKQFEQLCALFRVAKVKNKNSATEMKKSEKKMKDLAGELEVKGDIHGLKFGQRFSFLKQENLDQAKKHKVKVYYTKFYSIDEDRIKELLEEKILVEKDVEITEVPDMKKLEKVFEKKEIEGIYELKYSVGLSSLE